jgi:large subunit ribosomal protein L10
MNRTDKQQLIDTLHEEFGKSPHAILVGYKGLTVPAVTEFRRQGARLGLALPRGEELAGAARGQGHAAREAGGAVRRDDRRRLHGAGPGRAREGAGGLREGQPELVFKAGIVSGNQLLDTAGVKALSTMPSLPELRSKLLGLMKAPASQLVRLLNAPASQLARVLKAQQDKLEGK